MLKTSDMSNTIPDEKSVITYMMYLCARLLSIRNEQHAAAVIQLAWRRYRDRQHHTVSCCFSFVFQTVLQVIICLHCFDTVGWAAERASGL